MNRFLRTAALVLLPVLVLACNGGEPEPPGLSRAEVEEIVQARMDNLPTAVPARPARGTTDSARTPQIGSAEVERIAREAVASSPGISPQEVRRIARSVVAAIPSRTAPADYTRFLVDNAISRYETRGRDATLAHYNRAESIDGQWYVFIVDENDLVVGHPGPELRGLDLKGRVSTDANGYEFGPEMLAATEEGKWVSYVFRNPESGGIGAGDFELKNVWTVRHDGLLFASGWYIDADEFTKKLVSVAVDKFREGGLPATVAYFASPGSALAGLEPAIQYYNDAETVDGRWFAFIGDPHGRIVAHSDISMIGRDTQELFGAETFQATADGNWVESESLRVWVASYDAHVFGSGWSK